MPLTSLSNQPGCGRGGRRKRVFGSSPYLLPRASLRFSIASHPHPSRVGITTLRRTTHRRGASDLLFAIYNCRAACGLSGEGGEVFLEPAELRRGQAGLGPPRRRRGCQHPDWHLRSIQRSCPGSPLCPLPVAARQKTHKAAKSLLGLVAGTR